VSPPGPLPGQPPGPKANAGTVKSTPRATAINANVNFFIINLLSRVLLFVETIFFTVIKLFSSLLPSYTARLMPTKAKPNNFLLLNNKLRMSQNIICFLSRLSG
jgi:hypothetical protein